VHSEETTLSAGTEQKISTTIGFLLACNVLFAKHSERKPHIPLDYYIINIIPDERWQIETGTKYSF
jgi:hypothetical protein